MLKRITKGILLLYVSLFAAGAAAIHFFGKKILLHPVTLEKKHRFHFDTPFQETDLRIDKNEVYNIIQFHPSDSVTKGVVLYFHGNERNVERYAQYAKLFTQNGWEVWMPDYPGFGKSTGNLTEEGLYSMSLQLYKMARARFAQQQIIIYGKSFGTGTASYLAAERDCKRLILETPYTSIKGLINDYLMILPIGFASKYNFPTAENLKKVDDPISIFHGKSDEVIPYRNAVKLKNVLKPQDEFITIPNGKHNELTEFDMMKNRLNAILH